jgi:hypothetical protein
VIFTDKLPQDIAGIKTVTIRDVVNYLPIELPWKFNVWIGDKLARFGRTTDNLIFLVELSYEPTVEMREYFSGLVKPLGIQATLYEDWKNKKWSAVRLYNDGRLIIDKNTLEYIELPTPVYEAPILTCNDLMRMLPIEIPFKHTLYLTGGIVKNGWSANDVDFMAFGVEDKDELAKMRDYFTDIIGWKTHVGNKVMAEREPVYCYKVFEDGKCLV